MIYTLVGSNPNKFLQTLVTQQWCFQKKFIFVSFTKPHPHSCAGGGGLDALPDCFRCMAYIGDRDMIG